LPKTYAVISKMKTPSKIDLVEQLNSEL